MRNVTIGVPVRDEAATLPALLEALARQRSAPDFALCLLLDGCTDASAAIVRALRSDLPYPVMLEEVPASGLANAGRARRAAMALAAREAEGRDLLLTTDADSVPAPDWIGAMTRALAAADVVAGRIVRRQAPPCPEQDRLEAYYDRLFALRRRLDPVAWESDLTHHWAGGANLGFRADAYRALGGFAGIAAGEDALIVDEAERAGLRVRRDARCVVRTSARRSGRAAGGLAAALRARDQDEPILVARPDDAAWQYRLHALARATFASAPVAGFGPLARALALSDDHLLGVARDCPNGAAFAMRVVPAPPGAPRHVTLDHAERLLAALEADELGQVA